MTLSLEQILRTLDERPTMAAYSRTAREIRLSEQLQPVKVSLLSTFTVDTLVPYLEVEAARSGFAANIYLGPFNSVRQELLNPDSECLRQQPDIIFVSQLLCDVCPPLVNDFLSLDQTRIDQLVTEIISDTVATLRTFRKQSQATLVLHNFALSSHPALGIYEPMEQGSQTLVIRQLNTRLVEAAKTVPGIYVLDYDRLSADVGYRNWQNDKMWYLARAPLSAEALGALAREQAAFIQASFGRQRKCLVLDLDNTLWGGVIGEDGIAGIQLGHTYPGNAFRHFQELVLQLHRRGVLLAINSKNNHSEAQEVFRSHPDMVLREDHFAAMRINWRAKTENMLEIAKELNLGLDSLVFFDDNPIERDLMRQVLPQVLTLEVPSEPLRYFEALSESSAFDRLSFTGEDRSRGKMYQEQVARAELKASATSLEEFLRSLKIEISIHPVDRFAFPRVLDLIHKTNQFNLTTRRHSASRLAEMIADQLCDAFYLRVADRFGDNGIVGVAILQMRNGAAYIDTFLLSCRVIGRNLETAFLSFLVDWAKTRGAIAIVGEFTPTAKNSPAGEFFSLHGFAKVGSNGTGTCWRLDLNDVPFQAPGYIQMSDEMKERV
ncbi:MAG TPA: HAD-IIIC family phosphatase [Pyrinomonadaceae bacterium]|jgi:FkbH-like protein